MLPLITVSPIPCPCLFNENYNRKISSVEGPNISPIRTTEYLPWLYTSRRFSLCFNRSVKSLRLIRPSLQFRAIFREQLNIFQAFVICDEISQTPVYLLQIICISRHFRKEPWASVKSRGIRQCVKDLCQSSFKKCQMVCVQAFNGIIEKGKYWQRLLVQVNVATSRSEKAAAVTAWLGPPACQ